MTITKQDKYNQQCAAVLKETKAKATLLIVIEGDEGSGFSMTCDAHTYLNVPKMLREVARELESVVPKVVSR